MAALPDTFGLEPGRKLAGKYVVGDLLGGGWEGEVYHITEVSTGVERAAKIFYPERNPGNRTVKFYARKLNRLRGCNILIQYHTQDTFRWRGADIRFLVSEYVEGEQLSDLVKRHPGKRLQPFEGLHLLHALVSGVADIHAAGDYHGDLHSDNVIVTRQGLGFRLKLIDMFHWGGPNKKQYQEDLLQIVQIFYEAIGGQRTYAKHPKWVKAICCGLKRSLILKKFKNTARLRDYLERIDRDDL